MQKYTQIDKIKYSNKSIIDKSNIDQKLFNYQYFVNEDTLKNFYNKIYLGFPILLNFEDICFKRKIGKFNISKNEFSKFIFNDNEFLYSQSQFFFQNGNIFAKSGELKKKYIKNYDFICSHNKKLINYIKKLKSKGMKVGAFQTRNIPHAGHELIIKKLLSKVDIVLINPVIGPKKLGDFKSYALEKVFNFLSKKKYKNKIKFFPVIANMQYSGPREAFHHSILRENLGFDYFTVGRDHAGSDGFYENFAAINTINKYKNKLRIKILTHKGTYFCQKCQKIVFFESCLHKKKLKNISGSDFRKCITKKEIYKYADINLQKYIHKLKGGLFY